MIQLSPDMNFFIILMIFSIFFFLTTNFVKRKKTKNNELAPSLFLSKKTMNMGTVVYLHASHAAAHHTK